MSKQEAERLADALGAPVHTNTWVRIESAHLTALQQLLRQWPDGEPCAWVMPSRPPQYFAPVLHMCSAPPEPLSFDEAVARGWMPFYAAPADQSARIAELERQRDALLGALRAADMTFAENGILALHGTRAHVIAVLKAAGGGK